MKVKNLMYTLLGLSLVVTGCNKDDSKKSSTKPVPMEVTGSGTKDDPYVLYTAKHLKDLATEVNSSSYTGTKTDYYKLGNDIDLKNEEWTPIGNSLEKPFKANFNGNGHTISNLKITSLTNDNPNLGLFGVFSGYAYNFKMDNLNIEVNNPLDLASYPAIGGVAGVSMISVFEGIEVKGKITYTDAGIVQDGSRVYDTAYLGGIAGYSATSNNFYIDTGYCMSDVDILAVAPTTVAGGLFGYCTTSNYSGIINVHDSYALGDIKAGSFAGGAIGHLTPWVSVYNTYATGEIELTSPQGAIAGGLIGRGHYDTAIENSFAVNSVKVLPSEVSYYKSYAGGVVGYGPKGGLEEGTLSDGTLVLNSYAQQNGLLEGDNISDLNLETNVENFKVASWINENLKWSNDVWDIVDGQYPTLKPFHEIEKVEKAKAKVTLNPNYAGAVTSQVEVENGDYDPMPILNVTPEHPTLIFDNWYYDAECTKSYRPYLPITNDITLYARWRDYNVVAGVYRGAQELNGTLVVNNDGTLIWIHYDGDYSLGTYEFIDGKWFVFETEMYPLTLGTFANGTIQFEDANADYYTYTFTKVDDMYGDWVDVNKNILHFDGKGNGYYDNGVQYNFSYKVVDKNITFTFKSSFAYTLTGTIQEDGTIKVHFDDGFGEDVYDMVYTLKPLIPDYTGEPFLGKYYSHLGWIDLFNDGRGEFNNLSYTVPGGFIRENDGVTFKLSFSGNSGTVKYDKTQDVFFGSFKGKKVVFARSEFKTSYMTADSNTALFVFEEKTYLVQNNALKTFTLDGTLANGEIIYLTVGNQVQTYRIEENTLVALGAEYGSFKNGNDTIEFDGVGGVKFNEEEVTYLIDDEKVLVILNDGSYFGVTLDYAQKTYTLTSQEALHGTYFDKTTSETKDYKLEVTGYGFAMLFETTKDGNDWKKVKEGKCSFNGTTLSVYFGSVYSLAASNENNEFKGTIAGNTYHFLKDGYTPEIPDIPQGDIFAGEWVSTIASSIEITIDGKGNGTFSNGSITITFTYEIDSSNKLIFKTQSDNKGYFDFQTATINSSNQMIVKGEQDYEPFTWTFNQK